MTEVPTAEQGSRKLPLLERLSSTLLPELKTYVERHRGEVQDMIAAADENSGLNASKRYARVVDGLISALYHAAKTAMSQEGSWQPVAIAAVGSYGRNSLSLFSDLDVRLLVDGELETAQGVAEALLYPLWDAGLMIGHQVVAADSMLELAKTDLPTATSLLDWRHLSGEAEMTENFQTRAFDEVFSIEHVGGFIQRLAEAGVKRRERFGGSVFLLEPDLKNGAGGLRDIDLAHWAARARWRTESLADLVGVGVLLPDEWVVIEEAIRFVVRVRNSLHHLIGRRVDRLGFNEQEVIAAKLGYGEGGPAVEAFMSDYYRYAREIERTTEMILRRAVPPSKRRPTEVPLGDSFMLAGDTLRFADHDLLYTEPSLVFAIYEEAIHRGLEVADRSRRVIMRAAASDTFCKQLRKDADAAAAFRRLVCTAIETRFKYGSVLTELHEVGLLLAMIPEFEPVVGRVHHDIYHVYTVDVHSIAAVDLMRSIFRGVEKPSPLAPQLAEEVDRPEILFFATLLHDVGKDKGGREHAERGAVLAHDILTRLRFPDEAIVAVQHLIQIHLKMYLIATRRDLDDPRTLESFAEVVQNGQGLRELYLLTMADVTTTSPSSMTPWKARMIDELFHATDHWLQFGETRRGAEPEIVSEVRSKVPDDIEAAEVDAFLEHVPQRYLAANTPEDIVSHMRLALGAQDEPNRFHVIKHDGPYAELAVVADDSPGLLSKVCAVLSKHKLKVIGAQIYSWQFGDGAKRVLDLFWIRTGSDEERFAESASVMTQDLTALIKGEVDVEEWVGPKSVHPRWALRAVPPVPIQVRVDNTGGSTHTILEVITKDRADLLYWISGAIYDAGFSIELAKIHTEGVRVTDVFYVCTEDGTKITDAEKLEELRSRLTRVLETLEQAERNRS